MSDHTTNDADRLGGRHWTYGPGATAGTDRPGRWPERDDSDGWYSSGADDAHQRHLDALAHNDNSAEDVADEDAATNDADAAEDDGGWLIVDPAAPGGVRPLTAAEDEALAAQVRAGSASAGGAGPGGRAGTAEQDTAAAVERAHRTVRDAADRPSRRSRHLDDETRRAERGRLDPDPCCRTGDELTAEPDGLHVFGWGDGR